MPGSRKQRTILITGASGDLGRALSALATASWNTVSTYYRNPQIGGGQPVQLNLRDKSAALALAEQMQPDVIIHAAASDSSEDMAATNREAAQTIVAAARAINARLIPISTDMIFDGTQAPYAEDDPPAPRSDYGRVKAENEAMFRTTGENCLVVRTSLIYDFTPPNKQLSWMLNAVAADKPITLFVDEMRSPIWSWNLAEALLELAESQITGVLQVAGPQPISRWQLGTALLRAQGLDAERIAERVYAADLAPNRPRDLTLSPAKAQRVLNTPLLTIEEAYQRATRL